MVVMLCQCRAMVLCDFSCGCGCVIFHCMSSTYRENAVATFEMWIYSLAVFSRPRVAVVWRSHTLSFGEGVATPD